MTTPKALRIQALCTGCNSNIDIVVHPMRGTEALEAMKGQLRAVHVPSCYEQETPDGQDQGGAGDAAEGPGAAAASGAGNQDPKAH